MSRSVENSDPDRTLPLPELNPMLNPLLSEHMGRWAEVYFTNPPEKREAAVMELLRELEALPPTAEAIPAINKNPKKNEVVAEHPLPQPIPERDPIPQFRDGLSNCESCGAANLTVQRFCGMCGAPLTRSFAASAFDEQPAKSSDFDSAPDPFARFENPELYQETEPLAFRAQTDNEAIHNFAQEPPPVELPPNPVNIPTQNEPLRVSAEPEIKVPLPGFEPQISQNSVSPNTVSQNLISPSLVSPSLVSQTRVAQDQISVLRNRISQNRPSRNSSPRKYRGYMVSAIVIIIAVLLFLGWRMMQTSSELAQQPATAAPTEASQTAQPDPAAVAPKVKIPRKDKNKEQLANSQNDPTVSAANSDATTANQGSDTAAQAPVERSILELSALEKQRAREQEKKSLAAATPPATPQDDGSQELAMAQNYLNGTRGKEQDSSQAADWLWKAVRKENTAATLLLSDLYVQGNGVPKSCDQAHVLLNAAARKNAAGADERIRNLHTFGCQ